MSRNQFAQALGFSDFEALIRASESIVKEGDINWYATRLPNGHWISWDDSELSLDRVAHFSTRGEAIAFHLGVFAERMRLTT